MTESSGELAAVEQLLTEGDAVRGWLARLDQAPAGGWDQVRERVRSDYQKRLDQITAGLGAHADVIASKLQADRQEHADLLARATDARNALAEAELRHAVGEYDSERFQGEQRRFASDVETFEVALGAAAERISRLEEVEALVRRVPDPSLIEPDVEAADEAAVEVQSITIAELAPDAEEALTVFDDREEISEAAAPIPDNGPLSFRRSGVASEPPRPVVAPPPRSRPFDSAAPLGIPAADVPPRFVRPGERLAVPPAPPVTPAPILESRPEPAARSADDAVTPAAPVDAAAGTAAGRTLRCGECGAMNRPLEWYCEKCGAELTAV